MDLDIRIRDFVVLGLVCFGGFMASLAALSFYVVWRLHG